VRQGLEPWTGLLDRRRAAHLLRRTELGAAPARVEAFVGLSAEAAVDLLVDTALALPLPTPPDWANAAPPLRQLDVEAFEQYLRDNKDWTEAYVHDWHTALRTDGLREKMALFWHNHFVTSLDVYRLAPFSYRYLTLLRTHALGNFKTLVHDIGLDPAMLVYLNGAGNFKDSPNENYARELLELFTMGQYDPAGTLNYTQTDIQELARALTGWAVDNQSLAVLFLEDLHDQGEKTILGRNGPWGYEDVNPILFETRAAAIAAFLARKLYRAFVYAVPDDAAVAVLAQVLLDHDFDVAPTLRVLLKSACFFDEAYLGAQLKSPVELVAGLFRDCDATPDPTTLEPVPFVTALLGQSLLSPPNVAGWPGHHTWIDTTRLTIRWLFTDALLFGKDGKAFLDLVPLAAALHDPDDPAAAFHLPAALAEHLMAVPPEHLDITTVTADFGGDLVTHPIPDDVLAGPAWKSNLAKLFLGGQPWYEWDLYGDNANVRLLVFVRYLVQLPEYQLT
jgi:uncharacterized protein (DUF1800 family)